MINIGINFHGSNSVASVGSNSLSDKSKSNSNLHSSSHSTKKSNHSTSQKHKSHSSSTKGNSEKATSNPPASKPSVNIATVQEQKKSTIETKREFDQKEQSDKSNSDAMDLKKNKQVQ